MKFYHVLLLSLISILAGCSEQAGKNAGSRVAAVVNGVEITDSEVDFFYRQQAGPNTSKTDSFNLRRSILAGLVRTELLAQKSRQMNLDKAPDYPVALYHAKKKLLAGLAERKLVNAAFKADPELVRSVIGNNPMIFADRQLLVYDELLVMSADSLVLTTLDQKIESGVKLEMLGEYLQFRNIDYSLSRKSLTSDQIPEALINAMNKMRIGIPQIIRVSKKYSFVILLRDRLPAPITGAMANKMAIDLIKARQGNLALEGAINKLVADSQITYYGDYTEKSLQNGKPLVKLPNVDKVNASNQIRKQYTIAVLLGGSLMISVMILTAMMRIIRDKLWLPRLWPENKPFHDTENLYEIPFEVRLPAKIVMLLVGITVLLFLGNQVNVLIGTMPFWGIALSIVSGLIAGVGASQVFRLNFIMNWSDKVYLFIVIFLTIPVILNFFMIIRSVAL